MAPSWLETRITIPSAAVDVLGQSLLELGCCGITVEEHVLDTFEAPPEIPLPEGKVTIRAYFPGTTRTRQLQTGIVDLLHDLSRFFPDLIPTHPEIRELAQEDWGTRWQQHFPAFEVGRHLLIKPTWSERAPAPGQRALVLDPGQAFGTGTHATTSLCLAAVARFAERPEALGRVLDIGTGSGILAMAAAALGAVRVLACDIDPVARQVARDNIRQNRLDDRIQVTDQPLEEIDGQFDVILANILSKTNIRLRDEFLARTAPQGHLVLSGILIEQEPDVINAFHKAPLSLTSIDHHEEWTCLTYQRHG